MKQEEIMESCKEQLKAHVEQLLDMGTRKANIEIELHFYIRKLLSEE